MLKRLSLSLWLPAFLFANPARLDAQDHRMEHGGQIFQSLATEVDLGFSEDETAVKWDVFGCRGSDENKLCLKTEGELRDSKFEQAEYWGLYSRNISDFWDLQLGARADSSPESKAYLLAGVQGLAKYFFETEAYLFLSEEAELSARLRQEYDLLLTQRLILKPYLELELTAQDEPRRGAGFSSLDTALQLRYEISRRLAPYLTLRYERPLGETSSLSNKSDSLTLGIGLSLLF